MAFKSSLQEKEIFYFTTAWIKIARIVPLNYSKVTNILLSIYFLLLSARSWTEYGPSPLEWDWMTRILWPLNLVIDIWIVWKYKYLQKNQDDSSIGLRSGYTVVNLRLMSRIEFIYKWSHFFVCLNVYFLVIDFNVANVLNVISSIYIALVLIHMFDFLDLSRPTSTVWQDISDRRKTKVKYKVPAMVYA